VIPEIGYAATVAALVLALYGVIAAAVGGTGTRTTARLRHG